ncbi:hypothetical protein PJV89_05355 [Aliarcobacter butzleri]|uniref:hypothetical protein n=1 Tax=Aliarcobacter butzleri TaxID=28197 RepID=UPI00263CF70F|nr:hypothetical protein [Aliarcobacter butzleri]MDN5077630.1 hypothetical protein [Aliarcobacter butzleri]MDN5118822.1 hypothetical protein [Aliarcobacter butzleri]
MKRKIDINKINCLLKESESTPKQLADFIDYPITNLTLALGKKHNRSLPMDYLLSVADFFKVQPKDITICVNENISTSVIEDEVQKTNQKYEV